MEALNPALFALAQHQTWQEAGGSPMEKIAVVPPGGGDPMAGGAPPMDPMAAGGMPPPGGAPPMPGAPPMDPAMMGGAPPMPGAPPMDPMAAAAGGMPMDPAAAAGGAGQKMKPEQMMQMLDFRMYNLQQQLTAIMNAMDIKLDPGALITPPGSPTPVAEAAVPGGPQDPAQSMAPGGDQGGGSAINAIEPMQGASPDLAAGGGGAPKMASFSEHVEKIAEGKAKTRSTDGDVDEEGPRHSSSPAPLKGGHPGVRPSTQAITAGGSKDPLSVTEGKMPKAAAFGAILARNDDASYSTLDVLNQHKPGDGAEAITRMLRQQTAV